MQYKKNGTLMESVDIHLKQGESIYSESGGMAWMRGSFKMEPALEVDWEPDWAECWQVNLCF
ncbi:MAG: hypothetical protein KAH12_09210 [Anaerolineales bacterium]|nr:hypothetical protein [Anaerolineales bacterium]